MNVFMTVAAVFFVTLLLVNIGVNVLAILLSFASRGEREKEDVKK